MSEGITECAALFPDGKPHALFGHLNSVLAFATGEEGRVIHANPGFYRLFPFAVDDPPYAASFLVNPRYATIIAAPPGSIGAPAFRGTITLTHGDASATSFSGVIFRLSTGIACIAENDVLEQERLIASTLELNSALADNQRALIRANRMIEAERRRQANLVRELTDAREQLMQSERLSTLGKLAAGVAHEINNPLAALIAGLSTLEGYSRDLLQLAAVDPPSITGASASDLEWLREDVPQVLKEMSTCAARVRSVVDALRDFTRPGESVRQAIDPARALTNAVLLLGDQRGTTNIICDIEPLPAVECVPAQIGQVFLLLLDNALQAIGPDGTVRLTGGNDKAQVWLRISDNGCGIADHDLPHIFDPFFTTRAVGSGLGLGLYIVWRIVRDHGGSIDVESESGRGSTFTVRLPLPR